MSVKLRMCNSDCDWVANKWEHASVVFSACPQYFLSVIFPLPTKHFCFIAKSKSGPKKEGNTQRRCGCHVFGKLSKEGLDYASSSVILDVGRANNEAVMKIHTGRYHPGGA